MVEFILSGVYILLALSALLVVAAVVVFLYAFLYGMVRHLSREDW